MSTSDGDTRERVAGTLAEAADATVHGGGDAPSRAVELLGRVGLVAYGLVHVLLGGLTVRLALGAPGIEADQQGRSSIGRPARHFRFQYAAAPAMRR